MADEIKRAKLKTAASLRAQFNYEMALARIDHKLDVIEPAMAEIEAKVAQGELPVFVVSKETVDDTN